MDVILTLMGLFLTLESIAVLNLMRRKSSLICMAKYLITASLGVVAIHHGWNHIFDWYDFALNVALSLFVLYYHLGRRKWRRSTD